CSSKCSATTWDLVFEKRIQGSRAERGGRRHAFEGLVNPERAHAKTSRQGPLIGRGCRALPPSGALCLPYATGSAAEAVPRAAAIGRGAGGQPLPPTGRLSFQPRRLCHRSFTLGSSPFEPPGHYSQEKYSSQAHGNYFLA
ncbi:hypothetical protein B0H14DRAFT_3139934, partial [Mycena olivaceomarginata]